MPGVLFPAPVLSPLGYAPPAVRPFAPADLPGLVLDLESTGTFYAPSAAHFSAAQNQTLSRASNPTLQVAGTSFILLAWVRLDSKTTYRPVVEKRNGDSDGSLEYLLRYSNVADFGVAKRFELDIYNNASYAFVQAVTLGEPALNTWYFIAAWFDSVAGTLNIQVNNGAVDSAAGHGTANAAYPFAIGGVNTSNTQKTMDGLIGPVALFKRVLTPAERTALYNGGVALSYAQLPGALTSESASTFVSWWDNSEASGTHSDSRATANHLTNNNGVIGAAGLGQTPVSNNGGVGVWVDASGNANNADSKFNAPPTCKTGILNGRPVVEFGGSNSLTTPYSPTGQLTLFIVRKYSSLAAAEQNLCVCDNRGALDGGFLVGAKLDKLELKTGKHTGGWPSGVNYNPSAVTLDTGWSIDELVIDATTTKYLSNLVPLIDDDSVVAGTIGQGDQLELGINAEDHATLGFTGQVAAVLLYTSALTLADRKKVRDYLNALYLISILNIEDSRVTVGGTLTLQPEFPAPMTITCDDAAFVETSPGSRSFVFTPIFEDGGTVRQPTFSGTWLGITYTKTVKVYSFPNFSSWVKDPANPLAQQYLQTDSFWIGPLDDLGDGRVAGLGSMNTTMDDTLDDLGLWTATKASLLRTISVGPANPVVVRGGVGAWDRYLLLHPTVTLGPATGGPLVGKYLRFYAGGSSISSFTGRSLGLIYSDDKLAWTKFSGNPVLADSDLCSAWQDGTTIYLYAMLAGSNVRLYTVPLADPTQAPTFVKNVILADDYVNNLLDCEVVRNVYGSYECVITESINGQSLRYLLSADGRKFVDYGALVMLPGAPGEWDQANVGDGVLTRVENWQYIFYGGRGFDASTRCGLFKAQSSTTGHYLAVTTTTYQSGSTSYAVSPSGHARADMDALPASGQVAVTATVYGASNVSLTVAATNGVSVAFTLRGMTPSHLYTVQKNAVTVATPTSSAGGVLTFSNSVWGSSDTVTVS